MPTSPHPKYCIPEWLCSSKELACVPCPEALSAGHWLTRVVLWDVHRGAGFPRDLLLSPLLL